MANWIPRLTGAFLLVALIAQPAFGQGYPTRPVRVVVAFAPGTTSDIVGRMLSEKLSQAMAQPFVVENRTGAGGTIGAEAVAKAPADGYTLLVSTAALPVSAHVYPNLKYDTARDFASITVVSHSPLALAANMAFPPKTLRELIEYAKANPGRVHFGSAGVGTSHHLTGEKLKLATGIDIVHVPYKGSSPAHADLLGGQIQIMFDNIVALMPHFRAGKLRPLAVSSAKRHPLLSDVPSVQEAGVKDFETVAWFGFVAPAGTPREVIARLNAELLRALSLPEVRQRLIDAGSEIIGNSPEAADRHLRDEVEKWGAVVRAANVRAE
ncbi:MAG TPA: tripartite tricarboxylate transporter substrate binding protein [Burkholderiales bacterium]|nr:tripartite tricarboxylate transporter substrate binding protein [Burkholderiales bacterium]